MCKEAKVSRSGYYSWCSRNSKQDARDKESLKQIQSVFEKHQRKIGVRPIKMYLERDTGEIFNIKRILRIKKKYNLKTKIRVKKVFKNQEKKNQLSFVAPNILEQNFKVSALGEKFSTDVTYLTNKNGERRFLSAVKDLFNNEIVGSEISTRNDVSLVLSSIKKALPAMKEGCIVHSDQGFQYKSKEYIEMLKRNKIHQSMSRKGNCLDNAPIESFFGHMKDGCDYRLAEGKKIKRVVEKYIKFYNEDRPQWGLKRNTPVEYRGLLT